MVAHARYLAAQGGKSVGAREISHRKTAWLSMEARKARMQARLAENDGVT